MLKKPDGDSAAVVTGGARGIGLAVSAALAAEGVPVACVDHPSADFAQFVSACERAGVEHLELAVDVRGQIPVRDAIESAASLGAVRYAVNCAGVDGPAVSAIVAADEWHRVMDIDLDGVFYACQAEYALMRAAGGSIVNIASMSGSIINRGAPHASYSAAKAAVIHLSKALGVEWAGEGIRVNSVSPGYTLTEMTRHNSPELNAMFAEQTPLGRLATVEEIAGPVLFLLGPAASFITGTDLLVDGGFCAW